MAVIRIPRVSCWVNLHLTSKKVRSKWRKLNERKKKTIQCVWFCGDVWNLFRICYFTFFWIGFTTFEVFVLNFCEFISFLTFFDICLVYILLFRSNMDAVVSSEEEKASPSKQPTEDQNDSKQENKERKFRFRHLTDECWKYIVG